jgi:hypothetical protein
MRHPRRLSVLFFIGVLAAGSTALGYYYYFVYEPPLAAADAFMRAMEKKDAQALQEIVLVTSDHDATLREPMPDEIARLLKEPFHRGRILDQDRQTGASQNYNYLIYREPDGSIYKLIAAQMGLEYKIVIPDRPAYPKTPYLWDYSWTN